MLNYKCVPFLTFVSVVGRFTAMSFLGVHSSVLDLSYYIKITLLFRKSSKLSLLLLLIQNYLKIWTQYRFFYIYIFEGGYISCSIPILMRAANNQGISSCSILHVLEIVSKLKPTCVVINSANSSTIG